MHLAVAHTSKMAFHCHYNHFEWVILQFSLANAPSTFQQIMNHILALYLDRFVLVYLDDILIYSKSEDKHAEHIGKIL